MIHQNILTWSENCTRVTFRKTSDEAGCLYYFEKILCGGVVITICFATQPADL